MTIQSLLPPRFQISSHLAATLTLSVLSEFLSPWLHGLYVLPRHTDPVGLCWTNWHCRLFNRNNYFSCAKYLLCYWKTCHPNTNIEQKAHNIYSELWVISGTTGTFKNGNLVNSYYSHIFRVWPEKVQLLSNARISLYMVSRVKGDKGSVRGLGFFFFSSLPRTFPLTF